MPNAGAAFYRPASLSAWSCGMFSKDKQRTLALGNRMPLQCAAPREWTHILALSSLAGASLSSIVIGVYTLVIRAKIPVS